MYGMFMSFGGYEGLFSVYFASETAQVELESGRVQAPAEEADTTWVSTSRPGTIEDDDLSAVSTYLSNSELRRPPNLCCISEPGGWLTRLNMSAWIWVVRRSAATSSLSAV